MRVIAEGVENLRQMEVLHRLGCGVMQGFLFSKPQPPDDTGATGCSRRCCRARRPWIGQVEERRRAGAPDRQAAAAAGAAAGV